MNEAHMDTRRLQELVDRYRNDTRVEWYYARMAYVVERAPVRYIFTFAGEVLPAPYPPEWQAILDELQRDLEEYQQQHYPLLFPLKNQDNG